MAAAAETYIFVDDIAEVRRLRDEVRLDSTELLAERQALMDAGQELQLPLAIDALSTADAVLAATPGSAERMTLLEGLELDCQRLVGEWYRKNTAEYFAPSRHFFDAISGDFVSHGLSIRQMTENAIRPIVGDPEEEARRINERVENETPQIVQKVGGVALAGLGIRTISECTDKAAADYEEDQRIGAAHRGYGGYVPEIRKLMIRDIRIDEQTGDRLEEQVGVPGIYITHDIIQRALSRYGLDASDLDKTALHGAQLVVGDSLLDFVRTLDEVATEEWCVEREGMTIFMGEAVSEDTVKDYEGFKQEALRRQESLRSIAEVVATYILDLAEDGFDRRKAPAHVEDFVKKLLLEEAKKDRQTALNMFDEKTAQGLAQVHQLEIMGNYHEAFLLMQAVEEAAPGGGYCSGGSCGLENVDVTSFEGMSLLKSLKAEKGDTVLKDKVRACRDCGSKSVVYAYNSKRVNKYCTNNSCKAFESKESKK